MTRIINVDGKDMRAVCSAMTPREYRAWFNKDLIMVMANYKKAYEKDPESVDSRFLENLAWIMFRAGGEDVGESVEEWLQTLSASAIYSIQAEIMDLWQADQVTTSVPKKK